MRIRRADASSTADIQSWEDRPEEIKKLTSQGIIPVYHDLENDDEKGTAEQGASQRYLMGKVAAVLEDILPAATSEWVRSEREEALR